MSSREPVLRQEPCGESGQPLIILVSDQRGKVDWLKLQQSLRDWLSESFEQSLKAELLSLAYP